MNLNDEDLDRLSVAASEAAAAAGAFQVAEFRSRGPGWGEAKDASDYVSFVDVESENLLRSRLSAALPEAGFFGEETERSRGELTWVVDPLDGTTNFLSGFDYFAVSIALWDPKGPLVATVLRPSTGERFEAVRGKGARRNGAILPRAERLDPGAALVGTGTPYRSPDTIDAFFVATRTIMSRCRDIRRTGSAALDFCYLAAGYLQGFWEVDLQPYDVAAGLLMLSETGHLTADFAGGSYDAFSSRTFVGGRPGVFETLSEAVLAAYGPMH